MTLLAITGAKVKSMFAVLVLAFTITPALFADSNPLFATVTVKLGIGTPAVSFTGIESMV